MNLIEWEPNTFKAAQGHEDQSPFIHNKLDLTELHGETEYVRQLAVVDTVGHGQVFIARTMNRNQVRAMDPTTGKTVWLSQEIAPYPESNHISQLGVGDMTGNGRQDVFLASYHGDCICFNADDGSLQWHNRLPWHINNPRLDIRKALPGTGGQVALVVGKDFEWCGPKERQRINLVRNPTLILLGGEGNVVMEAPEYSEDNGSGHDVWMSDFDDDGLCEILCSGHEELLAFRSDGTRLFSLPCLGEGDHADSLIVGNWFPERPGKEIAYLDGTTGIIIASSSGEIIGKQHYPPELVSHLQNLTLVSRNNDLFWVGENIRSRDSKLLFGNRNLEIEWAAHMEGDMCGTCLVDWDGDGELEIVCGSHGKGMFNTDGVETCSLQVMKLDGTPIYWHHWENATLCGPRAIIDAGPGHPQQVVVGVGTPGGKEGRFSLAADSRMRFYVFGTDQTHI